MFCSECGSKNPDTARFCSACGRRLAAEPAAAAEPASPAAPAAPTPPETRSEEPPEERKVVTVLFCDLVGFTAHSDRADPEDVRASLRPYHALAKREIERFGGTLDKFIGDGVLGVFGAPLAHEDDPERAVRAGLRLLQEIEALRERDPRAALQVRVGIETGEAVVALGAGPVIGEAVAGDVVNTASRIQGVAPPGGLVVGRETHRATEAVIDYEALAPVAVKGKVGEIPIWLARGARARTGTEADAPPATPFVGRDMDIDVLRAVFGRMLRERSMQFVTVWGEPGIGKSRLLQEFRRQLDESPDPIRWRQGRCLAYGDGISFWALGEIVKADAGILETDDRDAALTRLRAAVGAVIDSDEPEHNWVVARLGALVGATPDQDAGAGAGSGDPSFAAWRRYLEALAAVSPTVLVFEDMHWADDAMVAFVDDLAADPLEGQLLIVCTARPELFERHPTWGGGKRNVTSLALGPLTRHETDALFDALLADVPVPDDVRAGLSDRVDGNPLFAEEFGRMLEDRGSAASTGALPLPTNIRSLIASRLDGLPPDRKALAHSGSVVGTTFWSGAVAAMEQAPEAQVSEALADMSERGIVRPARSSSMAGTREYSFAHALVRDVAYAQVPRLRRAHRHRAAAAWMESMAGERLSDVADVIVHHYEQAMALLGASDAPGEAAELREPTRRFLRMAGDRAMQLDVGRAYRRYERALELCAPDEPDGVEAAQLKMKARAAAWQLGRNDDARRLCEEAREIFRRNGDVVAEADATVRLANLLWNLGDSATARPMLEAAATTLERMDPGPELIDAKVAMAFQRIVSGAPAEAIPMLNEVIALTATHGSEDQRLEALGHRGMARSFTGDAGGINDLREALAGALERGYATLTGLFYNNLAELVWTGEGPTQALDLLRAGIDFTDTAGIDEMALALRANSLAPAFDAGRWDEVILRGKDVVTRSEARGSLYWVAIAQPPIAMVLARTGSADEAAAIAERSLTTAREIGDPQLLLASLAAAAVAEVAAGRPDRAAEFVREADEATREGAAWYRALYAADLVRSALACGDQALAARLLDGTQPLALRHRLAILTADANLALARGDAGRAGDLFAEAIHGWEAYGHPLEAALARLGLARARRALGDMKTGGEAAREAREAFVSLGTGAQPLVAEADEVLTV